MNALVKRAALSERNGSRINAFLEKQASETAYNFGKRMGEKVPSWLRGGLQGVDNATFGSVFGSGFAGDGLVEKGKRILLGEKAKSGPFAGKRLHAVEGPIHQAGRLIDPEKAKSILAGDIPGKVTKGKVGDKTVYYAQKYRPKGLVGWGLRNPGKTGLAALAAYLLLKPENRQVAGGMVSGLTPTMPKGPTADVAKEWGQNQQPAQSVLRQQAWG